MSTAVTSAVEPAILIVDDEENILKSLTRLFRMEGYAIETALSGADALQAMDRSPARLVISDFNMPGMNGATLLREIRKHWPDTIRIMLTGVSDIRTVVEAVNEGAVYKFIAKPWVDDDLVITVRIALEQQTLVEENKKLRQLTAEQQERLKKAGKGPEAMGAVGAQLLQSGAISQAQLDKAKKAQAAGEPLGDVLVRLGFTTEDTIVAILRERMKLEVADAGSLAQNPETAQFLPRDLCERYRLVPLRLTDREVEVAMADPADLFVCDHIAMLSKRRVIPVIAKSSAILAALRSIHGSPAETPEQPVTPAAGPEVPAARGIVVVTEEEETKPQELTTATEAPSVVQIVNGALSEAIRLRASDIHIEPKDQNTLVRYRMDGMLQSRFHIPAELHAAVISRIKILANMDISERRIPQDGRITVRAGNRTVDLRVSTMPTLSGEKAVLRILDRGSSIRSLEELGLSAHGRKKIGLLVKRPQGMIISTGPTGSGKTTLLYSLLNLMVEGTRNYHTIEDPVEYRLGEANQTLVNERVGLTFPMVLRATLRQDPDVLLVGEMRDYETADVAFKAALTGHTVLSSLHTISSVASVTRLIDMGVAPYRISSALEGIIAQRLARRNCKACREVIPVSRETLELLNIPAETLTERARKGRGCQECGKSGYQGRIGLYEIFLMNDEFRQRIDTDYQEAVLLKLAKAGGMVTLLEDGLEKVREGEVSADELLRVLGAQTGYELSCNACGQKIAITHVCCPSCGAAQHNICRQCRMPLEEEWIACPACGTHKELVKD